MTTPAARSRHARPPGLHLLAALLAASLAAAAGAEPLAPAKVPAPLRPWLDWALLGAEEAACPLLDRGEARGCAWPSRLELTVDGRGASFRQEWRAYRDAWVALPGDAKRWPLDVRVDGAAAAVADGEAPRVRLAAGDHVVTGAFAWDSLPDAIPVPPETGLLALAVGGARVERPVRDEHGSVFFQREPAAARSEDRLELTVHRKVKDAVPLEVETRLELRISGKNRELTLRGALLPGFKPMALQAALPAQLDPQGALRIQARPGRWELTVRGRREAPAEAVTAPAPAAPWPEEEVWVFEAQPALRVAQVEGVPAIDPEQTALPGAWRSLPAFRVRAGEAMRLVERRRGDADPGPDALTLQRTLWLDFDGGGYTAQDSISGTRTRGDRLDALPETQLGRVMVGGQDQLITRLTENGPAGVELRQREVRVGAVSRLTGSRGDLPAVGWNADFRAASARLHLPPGWRLFHARGADEVPGSWISRWSLLDLFLALVVALAFGRLWGRAVGGLALVAMALFLPEAEAPRLIWLAVLGAEALVRVVPAGRWHTGLRAARLVTWVALALAALPFAVSQLRTGLHPALEELGHDRVGVAIQDQASSEPSFSEEVADQLSPSALPAAAAPEAPQREAAKIVGSGLAKMTARGYASSAMAPPPPPRPALQQLDPKARVQTGPGVPRWHWRMLQVRWSGPVERGQRLQLWLIPPWANLLLAFLRVALLAALVARTLDLPLRWPGRRGGAAAVAGALLLLFPGAATAGDIPGDELLKQLRERLTEKPECAPRCASASRLRIEVTPGWLRARLEVGAAAATAVPLPGNAGEWTPTAVLLDGQPARALRRDAEGALWVALEPGAHLLELEGPLPPRETVQVALPLRPHRVEASAAGWRLDGLHEDGLADEALQLTRLHRAAEAGGAQQGALPPFVLVDRTLRLGLTWEVETRVTRLTPTGAPVGLAVPLLPGESVTSAEVRVEGGKALLTLAPNQTEVSWRSALEQRPELVLTAPRGVEWAERWQLDAGPIWHLAASGLPAVQPPVDGAASVPSYRPWPGETLTVAITRPAGLPGQTLTIDAASLLLRPGIRATDATLDLTLRSSQGGQHALTLPADAVLQSVAVNDLVQPVRQEGRRVVIPVVPGTQRVRLEWREGRGVAVLFTGSEVELGAPGANARVEIAPVRDRWTLLLGGPRGGPAVLFWSLLPALLLVAVGLTRLRLTPLGASAWVLLGLGLTPVPIWAAAVVVGWLLLAGWRARQPELSSWLFDLRQVVLVASTAAALAVLVTAIESGLLRSPTMLVQGNGSTEGAFRWFQDRLDGALPRPWVVSLPVGAYRLAMLAWALWIAASLLRWVRWIWGAFTTGGTWRRLRRVPVPPVEPPAPAPPPA
jgi:hypothetical protein